MSDLADGWLFEAGIGENRALLLERGRVVAIRIERDHAGPRAGAVAEAKFTRQWVAGKSGIVELAGGEALLQPLPAGLTEGAPIRVEVVREAMDERRGQSKRARVKPAALDAAVSDGHTLLQRMEASGAAIDHLQAHEKDRLAEHGWHEFVEQAETGQIPFDGGTLLVSQTPAMTVVDVDGTLAPPELARRAARELALSLRRLDIAGNIGVDFPTLANKADRTAVAAEFDQHMIGDCERTAINGFGFMQVVSRKERPSVLEAVQANRAASAALALLRRAERDGGSGVMRLEVHPAVANKLQSQWRDQLSRRTGRPVEVQERGNLAIGNEQIGPATV